MINGRTAIGIVPARGGSKGLPRKNILPLNGKPLIAWTIEKARLSRYLDEIMVSTEDEEIAGIARARGASVPFMRPAVLAGDAVSSVAVLNHVLDAYEETLCRRFEYVALLEPTSPLREDDDIDLMIETLDMKRGEFDGVVSIGEVAENPAIVRRIESGRLLPFCDDLPTPTRRQELCPAYYPYGVGYMLKTATFRTEQTFYPRRCTYHLLQRYQNYEVDDIYDFLAIAAVMKHKWELK